MGKSITTRTPRDVAVQRLLARTFHDRAAALRYCDFVLRNCCGTDEKREFWERLRQDVVEVEITLELPDPPECLVGDHVAIIDHPERVGFVVARWPLRQKRLAIASIHGSTAMVAVGWSNGDIVIHYNAELMEV